MTTVANVEEEEELHAFLQHKWQKCYFDLQDTETGPRAKVDAITGILQQIYQSHATQSIDGDVLSNLARHYIRAHSSIVESVSTETGLNNYADGALTICANHPNESREWTSSLTAEGLRQLPCIQQMLHSSKVSAQARQHPTPHQSFDLNPTSHDLQASSSRQVQPHGSSSGSTKMHPQQNVPTPTQTHQSSSGGPTPLSTHPTGQWSTNLGSTGQCLSGRGQPNQFQTRNPHQTGNQRGHPITPYIPERAPHVPPQGPPSAPHQHVAAFASGAITKNTQSHNQLNERPRFDTEPVRQSGFLPHQGQKSSLFNSSGAPPHSLKRKSMFEEVQYSGDGQLPFRTSVPERVGSAGRRFNEGQGARLGDDDHEPRPMPSAFKTANEQLVIQNQKKYNQRGAGVGGGGPIPSNHAKKSLGTTRRALNSKFRSPMMNRDDQDYDMDHPGSAQRGVAGSSKVNGDGEEEVTDIRLKGIDPKMIELVTNEIMDHGPPIHWDDIAGLEFAKTTIKEIVVWPMLRPDIFSGLRGPPKGLLLFGPPGTGKTLIGKCIACQSGATFFSISASSLTSKWVGEGEKMVRALFAVARCHQPAVIFIDEIDSLLSQRSNDEHESSRRIKTEFLVQLDGATTSVDDRLLVVGATNRPQEIDEAARRRLVKRLYIPLPEGPARRQIIQNLLAEQSYSMTEEELDRVCQETDGYSGADMANLCREAALGPIRCIQGTDIQHISADQVRPILHQDFHDALQHMRPSVSKSDLNIYLEWNKTFGSGASK